MPGLNQCDAFKRAEEICRAVSEMQIHFEGQILNITVSIGVAQYPEHGSNPDAVIQAADSALYEAKHGGRNQVRLKQA